MYVSLRDMLNFTGESYSRLPLNLILCDSTFSVCFFSSLVSPGASAINFKLFSFPVFTLRCFHYANTKLVAALMFFFTFLDGEMGLRKLTCLPLAGTYEKLDFRNIINHIRTGQLVCITENHRYSILSERRKKKHFPFLIS